jgi:hypothetical protein
MSRIEMVDGSNWEEFTKHSSGAVLMLAKSTCPACAEWTEELGAYLDQHTEAFDGVRFGKMLLDKPGLANFKRENVWIVNEVDVLPFNVIYRAGERFKSYPGGGLERLENRLKQL